MTPTYHPPERITYMRSGYWSCTGRIHKHKSREAAETCERRHPDKVPVGRRGSGGNVERASGRRLYS